MSDRLGLRQLDPGGKGLDELRRRLETRRQRVAGFQAAGGLALMLGLVTVLKLPDAEPLPDWAAHQPALRVSSQKENRVRLANGHQHRVATSSAMTLYLINSSHADSNGRGQGNAASPQP